MNYSFFLFPILLAKTFCNLKVEYVGKNSTFHILNSTKDELSDMFNLTKILTTSCSCNFNNDIYFESLPKIKNQSNFSISINNSDVTPITDISLFTNNKKISSFYTIDSFNDDKTMKYNISIFTQCDSEASKNTNKESTYPSVYRAFLGNQKYDNNDNYIMLNFTFKYQKKQYFFEYIKVCKNESTSLSAFSSTIMFLNAFFYLVLSTYMQIDFKLIEEINEMTDIKWYYGIIFIIIASGFLIALFFLLKYILTIFALLCYLQCTLCMYFTAKFFIKKFLKKYSFSKQKFFSLKVHHYLSFIVSITLVAIYVHNKHWIMNNIMSFGLVFAILSIILFKSFKVCFVFLFCVFLYDSFWVFYSEKIFSDNVMAYTATSIDLPIKLEMPVLFSLNPIKDCMLLGLGDIALPGLIVKYCRRFDLINEKKFSKKTNYYFISLILYIFSVAAAMLAMFVFQHGQPVLFYISPVFIFGLLGLSVYEGDLSNFWNGIDIESNKKADDEKELSDVDKRDEKNGFQKVSTTESKDDMQNN